MERAWVFPTIGFVKVNVHAVFYEVRLPNGNNSGIGVVIRDDEGAIIKMISGSIQGLTERANELWAMLAGLRSAYFENKNMIQLETDNEEGLKEWEDWKWWLDPNHARVIQQLEQRKKDPNNIIEVDKVEEERNRLARFLAVDGAANRTRLVVFRRPFGRVRELWRLDMGLGPIDEMYQEIEEEEYYEQEAEILLDVMEDEGAMLIEDIGSPSMGLQA